MFKYSCSLHASKPCRRRRDEIPLSAPKPKISTRINLKYLPYCTPLVLWPHLLEAFWVGAWARGPIYTSQRLPQVGRYEYVFGCLRPLADVLRTQLGCTWWSRRKGQGWPRCDTITKTHEILGLCVIHHWSLIRSFLDLFLRRIGFQWSGRPVRGGLHPVSGLGNTAKLPCCTPKWKPSRF